MATPFTLIDVAGQHIERVTVRHDETRAEVTVRTEHLSIYLPDPIGLWEQLTDALRATEGDHLREYLGAPHGSEDTATPCEALSWGGSGSDAACTCTKPFGHDGRHACGRDSHRWSAS